MPAVSTIVIRRSPTSSCMSIGSRVVPASSETITRCSPRKRLTSEDLPTLGRPITARRMLSCSLSGSPSTDRRSSSSATIRSSRSPEPSPWAAETGSGSPMPRRWKSAASDTSARPSHLLAATIAGSGERRNSSASSSSPGRTPARASTTSTATCASASPARACSRIEPASGSRSWKSIPPVSISLNWRPFHSQSSSLRSRVTPGRSCTTASRLPVRRLMSEDLPTLG